MLIFAHGGQRLSLRYILPLRCCFFVAAALRLMPLPLSSLSPYANIDAVTPYAAISYGIRRFDLRLLPIA